MLTVVHDAEEANGGEAGRSLLDEIVRDGANDFSVRMANDSVFKISRSYKTEVFEKIGL